MRRLVCLLPLAASAWSLAAGQSKAPDPATDPIAARFNQVYTSQTNLFSAEPSAFLAGVVSDLKPGKALDVGMGQGRNAVFLAKRGWDVTGCDFSDKGLAIARSTAGKAGVRLNAVLAAYRDFDFGREQWDLIVMTYALADMDDAAFLGRIRESLKPGGIVVVEQMNSPGTGKGPANALFRSFQDLRVIHYEDVVDTAEWGLRKMRIGRIVAQKDGAEP